MRVYFGEPTPIDQETKYLQEPNPGRLFFISPPPSPPVGWEMRNEDPPNKEAHANDLATQLEKLTGKMNRIDSNEDVQEQDADSATGDERRDQQAVARAVSKKARPMISIPEADRSSPEPISAGPGSGSRTRSRSSTVIYDPEAHGDSPALPAVTLDDYTEDNEGEVSLDSGKKIMAHTSRPPVELMEDA